MRIFPRAIFRSREIFLFNSEKFLNYRCIFQKSPCHPDFRYRIDSLSHEPLFASEEIYTLRVSDYQYSTNFEDGDLPVQAETKRKVKLRIGSRHCSRLVDSHARGKYFDFSPKFTRYGASLILSNFDRNHPMGAKLLERLLEVAEPFLIPDFRYISVDIIALREAENSLMPKSTVIDFIFTFEEDASRLDMKAIPEVIFDCLDYFENFLVEGFKIRRSDINQSLKWNHTRNSTGVFFVLVVAIIGMAGVCVSSFTAFCNWTDNFMALTPSGRLAPHLPSVISFILPTLSARVNKIKSRCEKVKSKNYTHYFRAIMVFS